MGRLHVGVGRIPSVAKGCRISATTAVAGLTFATLAGGCAPAPDPVAPPDPVLAELPDNERAPWVMPVPDGARTHAFRPLKDAERAEAPVVRLVEDLVISESTAGAAAQFGDRTPRLAVDGPGNIYVADTSNARVQVFDASGAYVRTMGRGGQGPGEFQQPMVAVVAGGALFVSDTARARLSKWALDGELVWDKQLDVFPGYLIAPQVGLADGSWLIRFHLPRTADEVVTRMSAEGRFLSGAADSAAADPGVGADGSAAAAASRLAELTKLTHPERVWYPPRPPGSSRGGQFAFYVGRTRPTFALQSSGEAIISTYDEYQLMAVTPDGDVRWALQVPGTPLPIAEEAKRWGAALMRSQGYADATVDQFDWPDRQFALGDVKVDGQGRIYAFPWVARGLAQDWFPVDVYSAQGQPILAGWIGLEAGAGSADAGGAATPPMSSLAWPGVWKFGPMLDAAWQVSDGDAVYGLIENPDTGEWEVRRWRIVWPT